MATEGDEDGINKILMGMDTLLEVLEKVKQQHPDENSVVRLGLDLGHKTLSKYYELTDKSPIYAASIVVDPRWKLDYFDEYWVDQEELRA